MSSGLPRRRPALRAAIRGGAEGVAADRTKPQSKSLRRATTPKAQAPPQRRDPARPCEQPVRKDDRIHSELEAGIAQSNSVAVPTVPEHAHRRLGDHCVQRPHRAADVNPVTHACAGRRLNAEKADVATAMRKPDDDLGDDSSTLPMPGEPDLIADPVATY